VKNEIKRENAKKVYLTMPFLLRKYISEKI
jgi:hypothetical protein